MNRQTTDIITFINLFFSGILAGSLFIIHHGIRVPLSQLEERPQIMMRQALIYRLRIMVPLSMIPALISGVAVALLDWDKPGSLFRCTGVLLLAVCFFTTVLGTVPLNKEVVGWNPDAPPNDWQNKMKKWERFDGARTVVGALSYGLMLIGMAVRFVNRDI